MRTFSEDLEGRAETGCRGTVANLLLLRGILLNERQVEALQAEIAQLRNVIAKVSIATEDTMTCDVLYTSSHKVFVSVHSLLLVMMAL